RAEHGRVLEAELGLELGRLAVAVVPLLARDLAGVAPDALRDVDQRRLDLLGLGRGRHVLRPRGSVFAATRSDILTTFTRQALVSCVPAPGSTASIVRWLTLGPTDRPR